VKETKKEQKECVEENCPLLFMVFKSILADWLPFAKTSPREFDENVVENNLMVPL